MKGSAPNSPETGSQVDVRQNRRPNFAHERCEVRKSSKPIPTTRSTTRSAKKPVPARKPRSSTLFREDGGLRIVSSEPASDPDSIEGRELQRDHALRERSVPEPGRVLLPLGESPPDEVLHDLRSLLVLRALVEEQPRKGRDRIDALAGRIRDRHAKILGHLSGRRSRGRSDRVDGGADGLAVHVPDRAVGDVVLERVDELDVTD